MSDPDHDEAVQSLPHPSVLFLTRSLDATGGAEQQLAKLALGLRQRGWAVHVAIFYRARDPVLEERLSAAGIIVDDLAKTGRWDLFGFFLRFRSLVSKLRPTCVYSLLGPPNLVAAAACRTLRGRPRLAWSVRASNMRLQHYDFTHRLVLRLQVAISRTPDVIIANSAAGRAHAIAIGFDQRRICTIPNGIEVVAPTSDHGAANAARSALLPTGKSVLVGMFARFDPMKDHLTFLRAAKVLVETRQEIGFVCVGDPTTQYGQSIVAAATQMGLEPHLRWRPPTHDLGPLYQACDMVTLTSAWGEGFPNVVGEAMAWGKPCVVTDVGDSATIVGDTGIVVAPNSPADLAAAWLKMIEIGAEGRSALGREAQQRVRSTFGIGVMVDRTVSLLSPKQSDEGD
jgi:glycosyltransferase involved in cell wall biosynthesis